MGKTKTRWPDKGTEERERFKAFFAFWKDQGNDPRELVDAELNGDEIEIGRESYKVLTDAEADSAAREYILESVWAFNKSFLDGHSEAIAEMDDEVFKKIQEMCEGANKTILRLIDDVDHFVDDAIASDGRGHFLNTYDGEENDVTINGKTEWFVYRTN